MTDLNVDLVDLTNCEREPIHILGHIQSHGYLIAILPNTYTIVHVSANISELVGQSVNSLLGQPLDTLLANTDLPAATVIELLNVGHHNNSWESINPYRLQIGERNWNLICHEHDGLILMEWEPAAEKPQETMNQRLITEALTEVQSSRQLADLLQNTARRVKDK